MRTDKRADIMKETGKLFPFYGRIDFKFGNKEFVQPYCVLCCVKEFGFFS